MSWNEDEEHNKANTNKYCDQQDHYSTLVHELSDVGFPDASPVHKGILAKASEGEDGIDAVLLRRKCVDADGEWEDELRHPARLAVVKNGPNDKLTQQRICLGLLRRMQAKPAQKAPKMASSPRHNRRKELGGTKLPSAFARRKPGNASRSIA